MVYIPAGEFIMGSDTDELNEKPAHKIYLDAYYIDKYEVTNEQFTEFLNTYGKSTDDYGAPFVYASDWGVQFVDGKWKPVKGYEKHPAVYVTWVGADHYARFYNKRLPTEAEWENACRAGTTTKYYFGDSVTQTSSLGRLNQYYPIMHGIQSNSAPKVDVSDDDEDRMTIMLLKKLLL